MPLTETQRQAARQGAIIELLGQGSFLHYYYLFGIAEWSCSSVRSRYPDVLAALRTISEYWTLRANELETIPCAMNAPKRFAAVTYLTGDRPSSQGWLCRVCSPLEQTITLGGTIISAAYLFQASRHVCAFCGTHSGDHPPTALPTDPENFDATHFTEKVRVWQTTRQNAYTVILALLQHLDAVGRSPTMMIFHRMVKFLKNGDLNIDDQNRFNEWAAASLSHWNPRAHSVRHSSEAVDEFDRILGIDEAESQEFPPAVNRTVANTPVLKAFRDAIEGEFTRRFPLHRRSR